MSAVKRFLFWDYPRAGWQYDVMVGLILAFIFLTPREWFRDQPRANSIVMLPSERGDNRFLDGCRATFEHPRKRTGRRGQLALLQARTGKKYHVVRLEPIVDSEQEIKGFMAFTTP